ncbi:putative ATPase/DNA-binding CsgD family transcriptional regulator [Lipingzhangella halophila]|uniref:Putative ATPase/DNA-binding CsgD family transcriptional regulator n=1 Tax=Lipingzhangella halophila TaxID=1783352 RepID=A0A7W7W582_9ACTN|nr:LuxR C-terminal-related transcriptional regulator [Lipingzhangella halophila]MBB4933480.1 putative ATPase/DNA-binding CsgD family transcriptional regulator [Lipingzhangella halophila]
MMAPQSAPARQNLPPETSNLVGRERDLSDLLRLLDSNRVVTLCGVSGIGKTRMALRVAAQATASFPDGVWFAELAEATTRQEVIARIAQAVGVVEENGREPAGTLVDALRGRHLLLILDGCDEVTGDVAAVGRVLLDANPSISLLLTSDDPVRIGSEAIWSVPPLALPQRTDEPSLNDSEAVRLFIERFQGPGSTVCPHQLRTIADLCHRLDGIPLCIELVAAWARHGSLNEIADLLAGHLPRSTGNGRSTDRQKILDAVLGWSHALLGTDEQALFRRLAIFPTWDLELAERVCSDDLLPEANILDAASTLVDRSLITLTGEHQGRVRYQLPRAVHRFAAERLTETAEVETTRIRHREQMMRLVEELGRVAVLGRAMPWAERHSVWQRVGAEYDNVLRALHWSAERGDAEEGLRMCAGLHRLWVSDRRLSEGAFWSDLFLRMDDERGPLHGRVLARRAEIAWLRYDFQLAKETGEEALRLCCTANDTESVLLTLNLLALTDMRADDNERASERLTEALNLARDNGDLWYEAMALSVQGALAARQGDYPSADMLYSTALLIQRGMDHRWGVGSTLVGHAIVAEAQHDLDAADRCYREALDIQRDIGVVPELARCLAGVGRIAHAQGATAQAYDYLSESLLLSQSTGQRAGVARSLASVAQLAASDGFTEGAHRLSGASTGIRESIGLPTFWSLRPHQEQIPESGPGEQSSWWYEGYELSIDEAVAMALRIAEAGRVPRPRTPAPPGPAPSTDILTRREREIAQHVAGGSSNREIAAALFITQSTVARHIANINRKTGFRSRKQIATWISEDNEDPGETSGAP